MPRTNDDEWFWASCIWVSTSLNLEAAMSASWRWSHGRSSAIEGASAEVGSSAIPHRLACLLASDDIQSVDDVEHGIRVDAVVLGIGTGHGSKGTAQGALLVQQVVELDHHGEGFALEEALRELGVPNQFVGVHRIVAVSSSAALAQVCAQAHAPGHGGCDARSVRELPGVHVARCLKLVAGMVVVECSVEVDLKPVVAIAHGDSLAHLCLLGGVLLRGLPVEAQIAHCVGVGEGGEGVDVPYASAVDGCIEHEGASCVPVAVDVFGLCGSSTGLIVVGHHVADAVACHREVDEGHQGSLVLLYIVVVEESEVVGERWLQSRISLLDVERIAVVGDVEQVGHGGLRGGSAIVDAQVAHLAETITEVEGW